MDLLKKELQRKRRVLEEDVGGKKFFKRSEVEQKKIQKLREEERRELELKSSKIQSPDPSSSSSLPSSSSSLNCSSKTLAKPHGDLSEEGKIDQIILPKQEVIRRLRFLKQPITLFGEDDNARLDRLNLLLKAGILDVDNDMTEGQTNDFLRDMAELRKRQKTGLLHGRKEKKEKKEEEDGGGGGDEDHSGDGGSSGIDADKDLKRMKGNFDELCDEDKILVFFKRLLNEWNQELEDMPDVEKRTGKGKSMVATYKQCARYLNPLFKFCRKKNMCPITYLCIYRRYWW